MGIMVMFAFSRAYLKNLLFKRTLREKVAVHYLYRLGIILYVAESICFKRYITVTSKDVEVLKEEFKFREKVYFVPSGQGFEVKYMIYKEYMSSGSTYYDGGLDVELISKEDADNLIESEKLLAKESAKSKRFFNRFLTHIGILL